MGNSSHFPSDEQILLRCRQGDMSAWHQLVDKYESLIISIPLNYGLSREDAVDIAQIAFTALIQNLETLDDKSNLGGWLATVARRHTWRMVKRRQRELPNEFNSKSAHTLLRDRTNLIERWELIEWLNSGLMLVSERCRALLTALYFEAEDVSYAEIAARLGIAEGSIGPTRTRCLQRMREILDR